MIDSQNPRGLVALVCPNMKKTTLENIAEALREMKTRVIVPAEIATRARRAIDAMLAIG